MIENWWKPNRKQEEFLALPTSIKEAFYGGGAGSGKSDVLLLYGVVHKWHENPQFKQVMMRRTLQELKKEILPRSIEYFLKLGATLNRTDMVWTFPRPDQAGGTGMGNMGAQIFLGHCENENDVHIWDSVQICLYTPDELTSYTEWIYLYISQERVRSPKGSGLPSITRAAGMPGGIGHTWVKKRFRDPAKQGGKIIVGRGGNKRIYIHATLDDNIDHIDPTYAQQLEGRPEAERKAKRHGDWDAYQGQVFDELREKHYPDEPKNAVHCIEPFTIPAWWPRFVIGDWGYSAMTYIGYYAVSPTKRLYLYREQSWVKTKIEEWAPFVKEIIDIEQPRIVKFCRSAKQDRGQEQTIQEQISRALGVPVELSDNSPGSRVAGKILIHEYLRWKQKHVPEKERPQYNDEHARWLMRNKGLEAYKSYLKMFEPPEEETNIPKLQIFRCGDDHVEGMHHPNCCPLMVESIKACVYAKSKDDKPAEDVAEFNGDDPYDDLRYACDTAERYFEEAKEEFAAFQAREAVTQKLQQTQDFTAFYRQMEILDIGSPFSGGEMQGPVRRYRH